MQWIDIEISSTSLDGIAYSKMQTSFPIDVTEAQTSLLDGLMDGKNRKEYFLVL